MCKYEFCCACPRILLWNILKEVVPQDLTILDIVPSEEAQDKFKQLQAHVVSSSGSSRETLDDEVTKKLPNHRQLVLLEFPNAFEFLLVSHLIE